MHRFQGQACCFACVVWTVPLEHILSQPLGVHACLMSHNAFMKRSLLSEVFGGHSGAVWMLGSYAIPLHNSNFDFACMSKGSLTKNQNENQAVFLSRVSGARAWAIHVSRRSQIWPRGLRACTQAPRPTRAPGDARTTRARRGPQSPKNLQSPPSTQSPQRFPEPPATPKPPGPLKRAEQKKVPSATNQSPQILVI